MRSFTVGWIIATACVAMTGCSDDTAGSDQGVPDSAARDAGPDRSADARPDAADSGAGSDATDATVKTGDGPPDFSSDVFQTQDMGKPPASSWITSASGYQASIISQSIAVDKAGNSYITGCFTNKVTLGSTTLTATKGKYTSTEFDLFVARLDAAGKVLWAVSAGGPEAVCGQAVAVTDTGEVFVAGRFRGSFGAGGMTLNTSAVPNLLVARLSSAGKWAWVKAPSTTHSSVPHALALGPNKTLTVAGYVAGTSTYPAGKVIPKDLSADLLLTQYSQDGTHKWVASYGSKQDDRFKALVVDAKGDLYAAGYFGGTVKLGSQTVTAVAQSEALVARFKASGAVEWALASSSKWNSAYGVALAMGPTGLYLAGTFSGVTSLGGLTLIPKSLYATSSFVAQMDSAGKVSWVRALVGDMNVQANALAADSGGVTVVGEFTDTAYLGTAKLTTSGKDMFLAGLNPKGVFLWAQQTQKSNSATAKALSVADSPKGLFVTGRFGGGFSLGGKQTSSAWDGTFVLKQ